MLKKLKALLADDQPPSAGAVPQAQAPSKGAVPKPTAKPAAKAPARAATSKAPAPPAGPQPPASAYLQVQSAAGWIAVKVPPLGVDAVFKGTVDPNTLLPIAGEIIYPSGTKLEGQWSTTTGLFISGSMTLSPNGVTTSNYLIGAWVPTMESEHAMNEGIGVRLAAGVTRDTTTYRVYSSGLFGVYKNNYNRLLIGMRLSPRPSAPKEIPCADLLPLDQLTMSAGVMNFDKNVIGQGCVLGATMTAGVYRMDGGVNQLQEGVMWSSAGVVEGKYTRRTDIGNASHTAISTCNRHIGRWRRGESGVTHLDLGLRLTCYKLNTEEYRSNPRNYVYCVEAGRFALVVPRRHRSGRKWYQKIAATAPCIAQLPEPATQPLLCTDAEEHVPDRDAQLAAGTTVPSPHVGGDGELQGDSSDQHTRGAPGAISAAPRAPTPMISATPVVATGMFSEGLFNPLTSELLVGVVVSNIADGKVPVWTYKPNKEVANVQDRTAIVAGQVMRSIAGFRKFALRSDMWRTGTPPATDLAAAVREGAAGSSLDFAKLAHLMPALSEAEALELERAWYGGEQSWTLHCSGRGDVYFGEHIDEGQWLLLSTPLANALSPQSPSTSEGDETPRMSLFTPIVWEERAVESLVCRNGLVKAVIQEAKVSVHVNEVSIDKHMSRDLSAEELMGSFSDLPQEWVSLPFARHEWLLYEVDLKTKVSRFALPCNGVIVDAFTASEFADDALLPRLTAADQSALDTAIATKLTEPLSAANGSVFTSLGHVNMFGPLRFLTPDRPITQAQAHAMLASWELGSHDATRAFVVRHPLVTRARQLMEEGCSEHTDVVDFSIMDRIVASTLENAAAEAVIDAADDALLRPYLEDKGKDEPCSRASSVEVGQHIAKQFITLKEAFFSSSFKVEYLRTNALPYLSAQNESRASADPTVVLDLPAVPPPPSQDRRFGASVVLHVPLPPDADCFHEYRHSWGFVLEYLHWVGMRHSCVALTAVLHQPFRRFDSIRKQHAAVSPTLTSSPHDACAFSGTGAEKLMRLRVRGDADLFFAEVQEILDEFHLQLGEVAERVFVAHTPFAQRMTVAKAAPWGHGIVCRFFGDQMSVTAAACEVSMWLAERGHELVRPPSSWILSQKFSRPLMVKEEDATGPTVRLFKVDPTSLEFCDVHNCLYNMQFPSLWTIVRLERVQNTPLYERYVEKRRQIGRECRAIDQPGHHGCNEHRWLAHGTRGVDPMLIAQHGFDHRYSEKGLFGRAAYFAYDPVYSHTYRHETGITGEAQMFLASVVGGNVEMRPAVDKEIKHPKPGCHSVDGPLTDRFRGLMVYDLDQAYPCYLVTYKYTTK
jgi:hypothetical protein